MAEETDIEILLVETLRKSDLTNVAAEIGELGIDELLDDGLFKDVPVISAVRGLWKTGVAVRDAIFMKKLLMFLSELKELNPDDRSSMISRLEDDSDYGQKVGEHLIILLQRFDNVNKPKLLAVAFKAYCKEEIDSSELQRFIIIIDRVLLSDLHYLPSYVAMGSSADIPAYIVEGFMNCGLAWSAPNYATTTIQPTSIARKFSKLIVESSDKNAS